MEKEQIVRDLAVKYARIIDDKSFDQLTQIMPDNVVMAAKDFEHDSLAKFMVQLEFLDQFSATMHLIGNQFGEWDGDRYQGETYCIASHVYEKDGVGRKLDMGIRYQDTIDKTGGQYKYTRRYLNVLWQQDLPLEG